MTTRESHKDALLRLLSTGRLCHMRDCLRVAGFRYGGRLHELRREGYEIETIQLGYGEFAYKMVAPERQLELV